MYKTTDIIECNKCDKNLKNDSFNGMFYCDNIQCKEYGRYLTNDEIND